MRVAVYPGSFDPITNGHLDLAKRAARLFDRLIIAVYTGGTHGDKRHLFSVDERVRLVRESIDGADNIDVDTFQNLTVDYARSVGAQTIVRGLRAVSDFEYEFKLAHMYQHLAPELEVICLMTSSNYSFISSSFIREVASLGGDVSTLVPPPVVEALGERFLSCDTQAVSEERSADVYTPSGGI
ncbi:MAG TPA: pantetheine-phosphate adenylyltransferase [Thermomicrobiales bacterium]|jgi:pantetheine-phosphate adenylyltransferase|nr:pantetheine-phosphate adenylyltransferase [Chloroflexota bacterium]HBY45275.1 pantetheine-phosphate adenylyltransferase [Chloroflexota bacterium]HCG29613.1 pantetheine-phosphate adenylyltransferase [Chloroflexota bacterium]HQZ88561.1 pantetheine-phosphate adenylyltransferase [Thermomicrobiales bacterium]HRA30326.1 pantetheine-phosphate adenylyltransferase [Thermomicrobiales bacterium]